MTTLAPNVSSPSARKTARATNGINVQIVRSFEELMEVVAIRSLVYVGEQHCPYEEEFDGNDFVAATHLVARDGREPIGVMRLRWFADFVKAERLSVRRDRRGGAAAVALIQEGVALSERKGYKIILGHIEARLLPFWKRAGGVTERPGRPRFRFSDREYVEVQRVITPPPNAISLDTPAIVLLRPEGAWDEPGVLDRSAERPAINAAGVA